MKEYNPEKIEKKWQNVWQKKEIFKAKNKSKKPKFYILVEFPYPSGDGLHVGHCRSYVALDILARKKRMAGFNVMFPMGWDAFGLPTENYSIKTGIHPKIATKKNTMNFKRQERALGLSFDWSREINTTDPAYYKWTQWIFLQLFKNGLAYKAKMPINWCLSCKIGLANEEVVDGKCERCGAGVEKKEKEQWMLKITNYAERLIKDLDLVDYPERVKISQKEWIGKSEGAEIEFPITNYQFPIKIFTTRPDTLFGCMFVALAPEHPIIERIKSKIENWQEIEKYISGVKSCPDLEKRDSQKEKTGIEIKGVKAINPINKKEIPIFVANYVTMNYGAGAIMAVPFYDERDRDFAEKYNLPIIDGGLDNGIISALEQKGLGIRKTNYKLRDWVFSRQRYWGEPIPLVFCDKCGWVAVPEKDLPVELPDVKDYKPTDAGESPLAKVSKWVKVACPECGAVARRETDVMPNWAGSNWYYLAYAMFGNKKYKWNKDLIKYWLPVDWYNGGMEHTTLHLLYSRFIYKFLWDIGVAPKEIGQEPYEKRTSHGMVLGEGGIKMSKSKGNVINPDEVVKKYGADTMRVYEMFMGPFDQAIPWDEKGIIGARRFLERAWKFFGENQKSKIENQNDKSKIENLVHKTIKKVGDDIESLKLNTAISALMILANEMEEQKEISRIHYSIFLILLSPFAPHLAEELWHISGFKGLCCQQKWPEYNSELIKEEKINLVIQINGKVRDKIEVAHGISEAEVKEISQKSEKVMNYLRAKNIKRVIFVPDKLVNFVVDMK